MLLWTIQPEGVYEILQKNGKYRTQEEFSFIRNTSEMKLQYDWLVEKMKSIVGEPPVGVTYPIWAWHTWEGKRKRIALRRGGFGEKGTKMVQMEIDIPEKDVLLSDYDLWVAVLNGLNLDIKTDDDFDEDDFCLYSAGKTDHCEEYRNRIIKSWDRCIGCEQDYDDAFMYKNKSIQATFWELRLDQVKNVWHFDCR